MSLNNTLHYKTCIKALKKPFLLFLASLIIISAGLLIFSIGVWPNTAEAQENEQTETPEPPVPSTIESAYNDQMTLEEVNQECASIDERITAEFSRLFELIQPFETSHPNYYAAEKIKIDDWLKTISAEHSEECQEQREAALSRLLPPSQTPAQIKTNYNDQMTSEEVIEECNAIDERTIDELDHLLGNIQSFEAGYPDYYETERAKIFDWYDALKTKHEEECQEQREAALNRQQPVTVEVDDLYPDISQEIKDLANRLGLTDEAKVILYDNNPLLFDNPNHPNFTCGDNSLTEIYIHGCWNHHGSIKILRDNSTATTLAHELLHAIYYSYYSNYENTDIDRQIDIVITNKPLQVQIILDAYANQLSNSPTNVARYIEYTELHSFIGTQFTDIPQVLENYYALYFKDRRLVVEIFHDWVIDTRTKITEQEAYNHRLIDQIDEYIKCLNDINAVAVNCQAYRPDEDQYFNYNECLGSRKTFLRDCRHLQPKVFLVYEPAPPPREQVRDNPEEAPSDDDLQELISETEKLADQINEQQNEIEESFVHQLVFYEHDFEDAPSQTYDDANDDADRGEDGSDSEEDASDQADTEDEKTKVAAQADSDSTGGGHKSTLSETAVTNNQASSKTKNNWFDLTVLIGAMILLTVILIIFWKTFGKSKLDSENPSI